MAEIQVTSATLRSKAEELNRLNESFKSAVETLKQTEQTLRGQYIAESSDTFDAKFNQDAAQWQNFYNEIAKYAQQLQQIADTYEKTEQANVSIASS